MNRITLLDLGEQPIALRMTRVLHALTKIRGFNLPRSQLHDFEVHYVTAGTLQFERQAGRFLAGPGDMVFSNPGEAAKIGSQAGVSVFHCHFEFPGIKFKELRTSLPAWAQVMRVAGKSHRLDQCLYLPDRIAIARRDRVAELFAAIAADQQSQTTGSQIAAKAHFLLLLQLVCSESLAALCKQASRSSATRGSVHITEALQVIDGDLARYSSGRDVAATLQLNPQYLGRLFRQYLGQSAGAYISDRRLTVAKERLLSTGQSIKQVAASVGFHDPLYFSRLFRKKEGVSPTEYLLGRM